MNNLDTLLENRKIESNNISIEVLVPKDFQVNQSVLEDSIEHSVQYKKDLKETMENFISYGLETEFWNAVKQKDIKKSILYLFSSIKNDSPLIIDSFRYALTDIDPQILKAINGHSITERETVKRLEHVAKILISMRP